MIIPSTPCGGPPGGSLKKKTKIKSPTPATVPRAIPPRRAPITMHASSRMSSIQIIATKRHKKLSHKRAHKAQKLFLIKNRCYSLNSFCAFCAFLWLISRKEVLDVGFGALLQKCQRQKDARLLRVQFV